MQLGSLSARRLGRSQLARVSVANGAQTDPIQLGPNLLSSRTAAPAKYRIHKSYTRIVNGQAISVWHQKVAIVEPPRLFPRLLIAVLAIVYIFT